MIRRNLALKLQKLATQFPALAILGPRQSGKTTLARATFSDYHYFSFEDLSTRALVLADPKAFLSKYMDSPGVIFDEIQNVPELFSYMQGYIDEYKKKGHFIVTGSQNLTLNEAISQSLAGRIAILTLLPLSIAELKEAGLLPENIDNALFNGMYPSIYADKTEPFDWYRNYVTTYIERDVRQLQNVGDLNTFKRFMSLCAGRIGQTLNYTSLSNDTGLSVPTMEKWFSILEASYIVFILQPYYKNLGKRVVKSPKLYFYDMGVACSLLSIENSDQIFTHYLRGSLFENYVIADLIKQRYNKGMNPNVFFWRDQSGYEIDCIIEKEQKLTPLEMKVSQTFNAHFLDHLAKWNDLTDSNPADNILVYTGELSQNMQKGRLLNWQEIGDIE
jgi:uncharacterized protein